MDSELLRVWHLVHELSDQLAQNQTISSILQSQAAVLKNQAVHSGTGFALRRYHTDISKETFESELERTNAQIIIENQTLLHENKQLSALLKEYEQTLETIMSKFRTYAIAAQTHESTVSRHYDALLNTRENQSIASDSAMSTSLSLSLQRLTHHLQALLHSVGEEPSADADSDADPDNRVTSMSVDIAELTALVDKLDAESGETSAEPGDWATQRESEIARLEKENEDLRILLGIDAKSITASGMNVDEERMSALLATSSRRRNSSASGSGFGIGGNDAWGAKFPQLTPVYLVSSDGTGHANVGQAQQGAPLQRAVELRAPGRRPGMFVASIPPRSGLALGRGGGPITGPLSLWGSHPSVPAPPLSDRSWQSQGSSTLDLSR